MSDNGQEDFIEPPDGISELEYLAMVQDYEAKIEAFLSAHPEIGENTPALCAMARLECGLPITNSNDSSPF